MVGAWWEPGAGNMATSKAALLIPGAASAPGGETCPEGRVPHQQGAWLGYHGRHLLLCLV